MVHIVRASVVVVELLLIMAAPSGAIAQIGVAAERAAARAAATATARQSIPHAAKEAGGVVSRRAANRGADHVVKRWTSSLCKPAAPCPLPEKTANTFVGGSYDEVLLGQSTVVYRAFHDPKFKFGDPGQRFSFWTRSPAKGTQAVLNSAIPVSNSGNTADRVVAVRVPKGTRVYEGKSGAVEQGPPGGGNQLVLEGVKPDWEIKSVAR